MTLNFDRVLLIEPHPDDVIIGAGGTISRLRRENPKSHIWDTYICPCREDERNYGLIQEHEKSCNIVGVDEIIPHEYNRNWFVETHKQEIRDLLYQLKIKFEPNLVIAPSLNDFHQDHKAIADCVYTIFRCDSMIWAYEVPRSTAFDFKPNIYVTLNEFDVDNKMKALNSMQTQYKARSNFFHDDAFRSQLVYRGLQSNSQWAEAFEVAGKI